MGKINHQGVFHRYALALIVSLCLGTVGTAGQTLHGKVVDARTQEPIIGAVVSLKGPKGNIGGAATNLNGEFSLEVKKFPATLVASYTGYTNEELEIYEVTNDQIQIGLKENFNSLNEVVVIGYGSVSKKALTGAISSVDVGSIQKLPITSVDQGLVGQAAGVQVIQTSGMPGSIASVTVRGSSSLQGGNEPLYVIDGFPIYSGTGFGETGGNTQLSGLSTLNPSDIESIEILKDAASTAIYGARAANGVVLITTKKGKKGQDAITFDTQYGWSNVVKKLDVMNAQEYANLVNEARTNDGLDPYYNESDLASIVKLGNGTDWQDEIFRTGISQSYNLGFFGGDEKTQYSISGNYTNQSGIIINTSLKRYTGLINLTRKLRKNFEIGLHATGSYMINQIVPTDVGGIGGVVTEALLMNPILPVYSDVSTHTYTEINTPGDQVANPVATAYEEQNINKTSRNITNAYVKWEVIPGLELKVSGGADIFYNKSYNYIPSSIYQSGGTATATIGVSKTVNWLNENTLTWHHNYDQKHNLTLLGGFTLQQNNTEYVSASSSDFVTDKLTYNCLQSGSVYNEPTSSAEQWNLLSYLGRMDYSFKQKYSVSLTGRIDGSSRFGSNNKYGFFPSLSGAWLISEEPWFYSVKNILPFLKLRVGYGVTGNTEIGVYQSLATLGTYNYIIGGNQVTGFAPDIISNPDLKWEKTGQFDFGIDADLFDNRLHLTVDYYYKKTTNMLYSISVPYTTGYETMLENIGSMENHGWEFAIRNDNIRSKDFTWSTNFNISFNDYPQLGD